MARRNKLVLLIATLCTAIASTQIAVAQTDALSGGSSVAFVYVSSGITTDQRAINAFSAASNGKLTPVSGSPFSADVLNLAVNAKYLFGTNQTDIFSFSIASDGSLKPASSVNAKQFNDGGCGGPFALFLDRTGASLYDQDYDCSNLAYQFFSIDESTGAMNYLGVGPPSVEFETPLSFIGNDMFGYGAGCYHLGATIYGFKRNSDQTLTQLSINPPTPTPKQGDFFCTYLAAADKTTHVAISVQALNAQSWQPDGAPQLATYTADISGNLTTKCTYSNMPRTAVQNVNDLKMSPSGNLLAVAGTTGLQVFHFHGSNPITKYTGLLTKNQVDQVAWDNRHHLYAISRATGKLFVFTVTPTSVSKVPGSPYTITNLDNIAVLPTM